MACSTPAARTDSTRLAAEAVAVHPLAADLVSAEALEQVGSAPADLVRRGASSVAGRRGLVAAISARVS